MDESLPTESITGQQDWEWNRMYREHRSQDPARRSEPGGPRPADPSFRTRRQVADPAGPRDGSPADPELERSRRRLQYVITHYERLLAEKNRRLEPDTDAGPNADWTATVLAAIRRLVARY